MEASVAGVSHPLEERIRLYGELLVLAGSLVPRWYEGQEVDRLTNGVEDGAAKIDFVCRRLDVVMLNYGAPDLRARNRVKLRADTD